MPTEVGAEWPTPSVIARISSYQSETHVPDGANSCPVVKLTWGSRHGYPIARWDCLDADMLGEKDQGMLTIAGGIVLGFLIIRFLVGWEAERQEQEAVREHLQREAARHEWDRLRLLGIRLRDDNRALYDAASARVTDPREKNLIVPIAREAEAICRERGLPPP